MKIFEKYIQSYTHNGHIGVLVEFELESSMPPRSEEFVSFSRDLAMHIAASKPADVEELLSQYFVKETETPIGELIQQVTANISEEICITRFVRWDTEPVPPKSEGLPPKSPAVAMRVVK